MKKISKFLAIFLTVVVFVSAFAIAPSAISSSSTAKEILDYYESKVISLSKKEAVVKAVNEYVISSEPDVSGLTSRDAELTKEMYSYIESGNSPMYFFGDANKEEYVDGKSQFIDFFSIKRDIKRFGLEYKKGSAKYSKDKNGTETITLAYLEKYDFGETVCTYTAKFDKNGYILYYRLRQTSEYEASSDSGKSITIDEVIDDIYTFDYKKVDAKSIELSSDYVELKEGEEAVVTATIKPENATFKGVYVDFAEADVDVISDYWVEGDGEIHIVGNEAGQITMLVYTYSGDLVAECEVVVTSGSFFDMILDFFRSIFEFFFGFLMF